MTARACMLMACMLMACMLMARFELKNDRAGLYADMPDTHKSTRIK
jgi:hypothetical protein